MVDGESDLNIGKANLHLPNLVIKGFRCINALEIPQLGRVTLVTGENGVGKTTLLEAFRIYAARGNFSVLREILANREELVRGLDDEGDEVPIPNWDSLFYGQHRPNVSEITIGPLSGVDNLVIKKGKVAFDEPAQRSLFSEIGSEIEQEAIEIRFGEKKIAVPIAILDRYSSHYWGRRAGFRDFVPEITSGIKFRTFGPGLPTSRDLARDWDKIALTRDESRAVEALQLVYKDRVERIAAIADEGASNLGGPRRIVALIDGQEQPVPLKSLGDGAVRSLGITLTLLACDGGILTIDEVENGIHHAIQSEFWELILNSANRFDAQVIASTHSWDCVRGFAKAASRVREPSVAVLRLEQHAGLNRVISYSGDELEDGSEQGIEVR